MNSSASARLRVRHIITQAKVRWNLNLTWWQFRRGREECQTRPHSSAKLHVVPKLQDITQVGSISHQTNCDKTTQQFHGLDFYLLMWRRNNRHQSKISTQLQRVLHRPPRVEVHNMWVIIQLNETYPLWKFPTMSQYKMLFVQTSTLPPSGHRKLTEHGKFCKENNELPTKSCVELEDKSNVLYLIWNKVCKISLDARAS